MSDARNGGPAFPSGVVKYLANGGISRKSPLYEGITMRDYFAAKAMQGLLASPRGTPSGDPATDFYYAKTAYIMADAMLAEREK